MIFGELFQLPVPPHIDVMYTTLLIELCKLQPGSLPQVVSSLVFLTADYWLSHQYSTPAAAHTCLHTLLMLYETAWVRFCLDALALVGPGYRDVVHEAGHHEHDLHRQVIHLHRTHVLPVAGREASLSPCFCLQTHQLVFPPPEQLPV